MKLQTKVLFIIAFTWLILSAILLVDFKYGIIRNYQRLEDKIVEHQIHATEHAFDKKLESLALFGKAFSQWDDAYHFMLKKDQKFIDSNFVAGSFVNSKINFLMYFDNSGKLYYGKSYDADEQKIVMVPSDVTNYIQQNPAFLHHATKSEGNLGILNTSVGLIVMVSQPVLTSDGKGPARGSLLLGYYLTESEIHNIAEVVGMDLKFWPASTIANNPEMHKILEKLANLPFVINYSSHDIANGYILLKDINENHIGILQIDSPRIVYQQGIATSYHYLFILMCLGFLVIFLSWIMLEYFVIGRIMKITNQVSKINLTKHANQPISIRGNDELNNLVDSINHMVGVISKTQFRLEHLANYDSLTQIPNREYFYHLAKQAMIETKLHHKKLAVMFLDMNKFKYVNDHYGHEVGDQLLQQAVSRIKNSLRHTDILARQSGDEFILLLTPISNLEYVVNTAERILKVTSQPYFINGNDIHISFSIGISLYPKDGETVEELLKNADSGMYMAKREVGGSYQFFSSKTKNTEWV